MPDRLAGDLEEIAAGRIRPDVVAPWQVAEFRRHLILLEALRRKLQARGTAPSFIAAHRYLAKTQRTDPGRVREILSAPQVGVWLLRCLRGDGSADPHHLQRLADHLTESPATPTVCVRHAGLALAVRLDHDDPHLDLYGEREQAPDPLRWQRHLDGGWRVVTVCQPDLAAAMAESLRVLVPLPPPSSGRLRSATSGWAFGAIAMSPPSDALECAETLVHEFRHVLLGAVTNHLTLTSPDGTWRGHAPWRNDPRPAEGLLQGCFAYAGLIALWRRLASAEFRGPGSAGLRGQAGDEHLDQAGDEHGELTPADFRDRATVSLETWHGPTLRAIDDLAASGTLTPLGRRFVAELRRSL